MFSRKKPIPPANPLLLEMGKLKNELEAAYSTFENVTDPDLIDSSIYQLNSLQQRYQFLLKRLKDEEVQSENIATDSGSGWCPNIPSTHYIINSSITK